MQTKSDWYEWQRSVIRGDEYKDILPLRDKAQRQFDATVKESLIKVSKRD